MPYLAAGSLTIANQMPCCLALAAGRSPVSPWSMQASWTVGKSKAHLGDYKGY